LMNFTPWKTHSLKKGWCSISALQYLCTWVYADLI
jgi:hypothetical protein